MNKDISPGYASPEPFHQPPDAQAALIDLLEHLLQEFWGHRDGDQKPQLLPGEMKSDLPLDLPMPEGARLVGSAVWSDETDVIFDSLLSRDEIIEFYKRRLLPQGWIVAEPFSSLSGGGFMRSVLPDVTYFCQGDQGPWLRISVSAEAKQAASFHVVVHFDGEQSPCSPRQRRRMAMLGVQTPEILPALRPPEGAMQMGGDGEGGADSASSNALLMTELDLAATAIHYNDQLEKSGWTRGAAGMSGPVAWSTWDFKYQDEDWHGLFTLVEHPWWPGRYRLTLHAEVEDCGQNGGIMFGNF